MTLKTRHWDRLGNGGLTFTELGFGTAPLGNLYRAISDEEAAAILACAWQNGVRYFDTAPLYGLGLSETRLNPFLRGKERDSYVLSSKVGRLLKAVPPEQRDGVGKWFEVPARVEVYDYSYDGVMRSFEFSLERLGVDRIDILYAHDLDLQVTGSRDILDARLTQLMDGGLPRPRRASRPGQRPGHRCWPQHVGTLPVARRARGFRPVPSGGPLHAPGTGGTGELPAPL